MSLRRLVPSPFSPRAVRPDRAGASFVGLVLVLLCAFAALSFLARTVRGVGAQRELERESVRASAAARDALETLRAADFGRVFALYNADPSDDPAGPGSAPGARFAQAATATGAALEGEFVFPTRRVARSLEPGTRLELREDVEDRTLGLPRDLSGDGRVDDRDHARDYFLLPVEVRVRWTGELGTHEVRMATQLVRYARA